MTYFKNILNFFMITYCYFWKPLGSMERYTKRRNVQHMCVYVFRRLSLKGDCTLNACGVQDQAVMSYVMNIFKYSYVLNKVNVGLALLDVILCTYEIKMLNHIQIL